MGLSAGRQVVVPSEPAAERFHLLGVLPGASAPAAQAVGEGGGGTCISAGAASHHLGCRCESAA